ncbi:hypothetical protein [Micromonospora humida]
MDTVAVAQRGHLPVMITTFDSVGGVRRRTTGSSAHPARRRGGPGIRADPVSRGPVPTTSGQVGGDFAVSPPGPSSTSTVDVVATNCGDPVAVGLRPVHSDLMNDSGSGGHYYWCTRHHRVETDADVCPAKHVLGPYPSAADAENALQKVQERNEAWEAEDARWAGEGN